MSSRPAFQVIRFSACKEHLQNKGKVVVFWDHESSAAALCAEDLWVLSAQSSLGDSAERQASLEAAPKISWRMICLCQRD